MYLYTIYDFNDVIRHHTVVIWNTCNKKWGVVTDVAAPGTGLETALPTNPSMAALYAAAMKTKASALMTTYAP
jgi:hypothetical protein